jgi:hypothetical protein
MGILEFPEAIGNAITAIGSFFTKIYWLFYTIGFGLTFIFYVVAFFGIQIFFIYVYYRVILIILSSIPKAQGLIKKLDEMF